MNAVHLFELGYAGDIDLAAVASIINGCQDSLRVDVIDGRSNIGEPDVDHLAYRKGTLFAAFPERVEGSSYVGVTVAPLDGNFYTVTDGTDSVIVTLHDTQQVSAAAGRTREEYVAQTAVTELLWLAYKRATGDANFESLYHKATRGCIFDLVLNKPDKEHKLRSGIIDPQCRAKLHEANVPESLVSGVACVLERIQKPSFGRSITLGLQRPIFSFVLGGLAGGLVINLLSSLLVGELTRARQLVPLAAVVLLTAVLLGWNYVRLRRPARQPFGAASHARGNGRAAATGGQVTVPAPRRGSMFQRR